MIIFQRLTIVSVATIFFSDVSNMLTCLFTNSFFSNIYASPAVMHNLHVLNIGHQGSAVIRALNSCMFIQSRSACLSFRFPVIPLENSAVIF
uniref:Uncharacterized protein n=1 Tax=Rhipicephalus zambeziensis TaxID=60191 RepID=A0A224YEP5_9ACAR